MEGMAKKSQRSLKTSKVAFFRSLVNKYRIESNRITSNRKPIITMNENKQKDKCNKLQITAPQNYS